MGAAIPHPRPMRLRTYLGASAAAFRSISGRPTLVALVAAMALRWTGQAIALVAYLVVAYQAAGAAGIAVFGLLRMVPAAVLAPFAGAISRRTGHAPLLVLVHLVRAASAGVAALALLAGWHVAIVFVAAGVSGALGALARPVHAATLPELAVTPAELVAANVASSTAEGAAGLAGPAIGAILLAVAGPGVAVAVAGLCAVVAAAFVATALRSGAGDVHAISRGVHVRRSGSGALALLRRRPAVALIILDFGLQTLTRGLLTTLVVAASIDLLGMGNAGVGGLNTAIGAGGLVGAFGSMGLVHRSRLAGPLAAALALWGMPIAFIGAIPAVPVAVLALFVVGSSNSALDIVGYTLLQRSVSSAGRAAVLGLLEGVVGVGAAVGALLAPFLIAAFGIRGALGITGLILPLAALLTWRRIRLVDDTAVVPAGALVALERIPLFGPLPLATLECLARSAVPVSFGGGEVLMAEGQDGDRYLALSAGRVEVIQDGRRIRVCGPGEGVGEIALLRHVPRTATVRALEPTEAYALDSETFVPAVSGDVRALAAADVVIDERLVAVAG